MHLWQEAGSCAAWGTSPFPERSGRRFPSFSGMNGLNTRFPTSPTAACRNTASPMRAGGRWASGREGTDMAKPTTLELTWIGKENRPRLEPRILIEDSAKSCHAPFRVGDKDLFDNRLIFGDNLLALKALEQEFAGKIKCIYIDPPYNTGSAFTHYDDGVEHSLWLSLMRDRLEILRQLLAEDGSIWGGIDDNEGHYPEG